MSAPRRHPRLVALVLGCLLLSVSTVARAADVLLLPAHGGSASDRAWLDRALPALLRQLDQQVLAGPEVQAVIDLRTDFQRQDPSSWLAVGDEERARWVVGAEVLGPDGFVRLTACWLLEARVQSLERLLPSDDQEGALREMTALLIRPGGVGADLPTWSALPPPVPPNGPPSNRPPHRDEPLGVIATDPPAIVTTPREVNREPYVTMDYMLSSERVWPPYSAGHPLLLAAYQGFSVAVLNERDLDLDQAAFVVGGRVGVAVGDAGLELLAGVAGAAVGDDVLWVEGGLRWMLTPSAMTGNPRYALSFHVGPELTGGGYIMLADPAVRDSAGKAALTETEIHPTFGAAIDMSLQATPQIAAEMSVGNLRWVPTGEGSLVSVGATLGISGRLP